jgi:hypothetical protein
MTHGRRTDPKIRDKSVLGPYFGYGMEAKYSYIRVDTVV